jgi:hypothetical protein
MERRRPAGPKRREAPLCFRSSALKIISTPGATHHLQLLRMKRLFLRSVVAIAAFLLVLYLGDTLMLHLRASPYSTVTVQHYYVIKQKNNKYEVRYDRDIDQPCANALFPHSGNPPCWYVRRHPEQRTEI